MMTTIDLALLIMRVVLGAIFIGHGSQKLFGWFGGSGMTGTAGMLQKLGAAHPTLLAWLNALSEFFGGVFVLLGFLTPFAAAFLISVMLTAIVTVHFKNGFFNTKGGYEFNLSVIAMSLALILAGAGVASIDHVLGIARPFNLLPPWAMVLILLIPFGGIISTELSRSMKRGQTSDLGHKQGV